MNSSLPDLASFRDYVLNVDLKNDANFTKTIRYACEVLKMTDRDLASGMRISVPTANRWLNGVTTPAVGMREGLRRFILKRMETP